MCTAVYSRTAQIHRSLTVVVYVSFSVNNPQTSGHHSSFDERTTTYCSGDASGVLVQHGMGKRKRTNWYSVVTGTGEHGGIEMKRSRPADLSLERTKIPYLALVVAQQACSTPTRVYNSNSCCRHRVGRSIHNRKRRVYTEVKYDRLELRSCYSSSRRR